MSRHPQYRPSAGSGSSRPRRAYGLKRAVWIGGTCTLLALAACGGKPLEAEKWQEPPSDNMEGPGLFTGEDGAWTLEAD